MAAFRFFKERLHPDSQSPTRRWYHHTPDRLIIALLAAEFLFWLSDRLGWPQWHKGYAVLTAVAAVGAFLLLMIIWFIVALVFGLRFQFSIRSLLILITLCAIPCSWVAVMKQETKREREAAAEIEKLRGTVKWSKPSEPMWLRNLLGDDFFSTVEAVGGNSISILDCLSEVEVTDAWFEHLEALKQLKVLHLYGPEVSDAGLQHLRALGQLRSLHLHVPKVTDAGLEHLKDLVRLQELFLYSARVTETGLKHVKKLQQLRVLNFSDTRVTDAGLEGLKRLSQLQDLSFSGIRVSDAGLEHLRGLEQLQRLSVDGSGQISDRGLKHLAGFRQLKSLHLFFCIDVTDAGMESLKGLQQLQEVNVEGTDVTIEGVNTLRQALPNCYIRR